MQFLVAANFPQTENINGKIEISTESSKYRDINPISSLGLK